MVQLNLPSFDFKIIKNENGKLSIFDDIRKKYIIISPEEWVRQNFIKYLIQYKNYPKGLIALEKGIKINGNQFRFDALCYDNNANPLVIIEFKAPKVKITEKVFQQAAIYNMKLKTPYLIMSNGISHYCCKVDFINKKVEYLKDVPNYNSLKS